MRSLVLALKTESPWRSEKIIVVNEYCIERKSGFARPSLGIKIAQSMPRDVLNCDHLHDLIKEIHDSIFSDLVVLLNNYHEKNYSCRFWNQIVQHWSFETVGQLARSYLEFENVIENEEYDEVIVKNNPDEMRTTFTSGQFYEYILSANFQSSIMHHLFRYFYSAGRVKSRVIIESENHDNQKEVSIERPLWRSRALETLLNSISKMNVFMTSRAQIFLYETYLNKWFDTRIKLLCRNIPLSDRSRFDLRRTVQVDKNLRKEYLGSKAPSNTAEDFIRTEILSLVPYIFLENFSNELESAKRLFPRKPEIICTGSAFFSNDHFKMWSASCVELGAKLVVLQHGNNFGTMRYPNHPEISYCDRYISWGWDGPPRVIKGFYLKKCKRKIPVYSKRQVLLVEQFRPYNYWAGGFNEISREYINDQYAFINSLHKERFDELLIRRAPQYASSDIEFDYWQDWQQDNNKSLRFGKPSSTFNKDASKSRLVVFAYYSTGFIDCIFMNQPTLCFTQGSLDNFSDSQKAIFKKLFDAKMLHFDSASAAEHVNQSPEEILSWWSSGNVLEARSHFLEMHARDSKRPVRELRSLILGK